jgi:predicted transposase YbfD/YdcC
MRDCGIKSATMDLLEPFEELEDPRIDRTKRYPLNSMLLLVLSAVVSDCQGASEIAHFGLAKLDWFQRHGHFTDGKVPSHDTIGDLLRRLDPKAFAACFARWTARVCKFTEGELVAIDGKRLRGSYDRLDGKAAIHMVSAWCHQNKVVLGQLQVDGKSNEITAIPALLDLVEVKGAVVSIDAIGCQKHIAAAIRERKADYLLGLKSNQPELLEEVELAFVHHKPVSTHEHHEKGHGRVETRNCEVIDDPTLLSKADQWAGLRSMVRVRLITHHVRDGKTTEQVRFYLSSLKPHAMRMGELVRQHWGIENSLHWVMDVTFQEDASRVRKGHADENLATVRRWALNLCRLDQPPKLTLNLKRKSASYSDAFRENLLKIKTR